MRKVVRLRPGVSVPDWSRARSAEARRALEAAFEAFGMARKWTGMTPTEDRVWRALLATWARTGAAPAVDELATATRTPPESLRETVLRLRRRDLVVLAADGAIVGAYPFTDGDTEHLVSDGRRPVRAMCAIDALGMGAMLAADTLIRSRCRHCGAAVEASTREAGRSLGEVAPPTAVVWSGVEEAHACAATSLCTLQAFFCSDEHLAGWRRDGATGFRLSVEEAFQVGVAIFEPMLRPAASERDAA